MKYFVYIRLARLFSWLEEWCAERHRRFNICPDCGRSRYYGEPCIGPRSNA